MNLPNKLTVCRIFAIPVLVVLIMIEAGRPYTWMAALVLFSLATASDIADGHIARKYNLVTDFGKLMDPLADKAMTCCCMICFIELGILPSWFVIIIVFREFMISGFRLIAAENGLVIAANRWGKHKTTFQLIMIIAVLVYLSSGFDLAWEGWYLHVMGSMEALAAFWTVFVTIVCYGALVLTVLSLAIYLKDNWHVMGNQY